MLLFAVYIIISLLFITHHIAYCAESECTLLAYTECNEYQYLYLSIYYYSYYSYSYLMHNLQLNTNSLYKNYNKDEVAIPVSSC